MRAKLLDADRLAGPGRRRAARSSAFETGIAEDSWTKVQQRDLDDPV